MTHWRVSNVHTGTNVINYYFNLNTVYNLQFTDCNRNENFYSSPREGGRANRGSSDILNASKTVCVTLRWNHISPPPSKKNTYSKYSHTDTHRHFKSNSRLSPWILFSLFASIYEYNDKLHVYQQNYSIINLFFT